MVCSRRGIQGTAGETLDEAYIQKKVNLGSITGLIAVLNSIPSLDLHQGYLPCSRPPPFVFTEPLSLLTSARREQNDWAELTLEAELLGSRNPGRVNEVAGRMNWNEVGIKQQVSSAGHEWLALWRGMPRKYKIKGPQVLKELGPCSRKQYFLSFNVRTNYLGSLLKWRFWFSSSRWVLRFCIPNKFPSDADTSRTWFTFWVVLKRNCIGHLLKMQGRLYSVGKSLNSRLNPSKRGWGFIAYRQSDGEDGKLLRGIWLGIRGDSCSTGLAGFVLKPPGFSPRNRLSNYEQSPFPFHQDRALLMFYKHRNKIQYLNVFPMKGVQGIQWFATGSSVQGHLISSHLGLSHSISLRPWWASALLSLLTTFITLCIIFLCNLYPVDRQHLETLLWFRRESLPALLGGEMANSWGEIWAEEQVQGFFFFSG